MEKKEGLVRSRLKGLGGLWIEFEGSGLDVSGGGSFLLMGRLDLGWLGLV